MIHTPFLPARLFSRLRLVLCGVCCLFLVAEPLWAQQASPPETESDPLYESRVVHEGVAITFTIEPVRASEPQRNVLRQGDHVVFRFQISDTTPGMPVTSVYPAARMDLRLKGEV
ncbi:MAG: hypothetical protein IH820_16310, partial [Bacteroidetes bacterium]|nr:hypothetical protein [Bacteroidota bacterium]